MLKFRIRQAGGCGRRPKNAKPTTKPNVQTQKKAQGPRNPPEAPPRPPGGARRHPGGARRPPGGPREAPEASEAPQNPEGHRENEGTRGPESPPRPRRPPDGFGAPKATTGKAHNLSGRSGIEALETRPWIEARQIREEWEFRASARNPKRYKVGWMPA